MTRILHELRVRNMLRNLVRLGDIQRHIAARKRNKREFVLSQQILQLSGFEVRNSIRAELYARKTQRRDVIYCLSLFVAPGHGRIAKANVPAVWSSEVGDSCNQLQQPRSRPVQTVV
jgi:hypothetical protein